MKLRDKLFYGWLILVAIAPVAGKIIDGTLFTDLLNALFAVIVNVTLWFLVLKFVFWLYDKTKLLLHK